jgi:required for meiotic nuclear division protein 1
MLQIFSYQIADSIDTRQFKASFSQEPYFADTHELFYTTGKDQYLYVFKYGVVCFCNFSDTNKASLLKIIAPYTKNPFEPKLSEEFQVETGCKENKFGYNKIEIVQADIESVRLIMLNVSQSVSLDYYFEQMNKLLEDTNYHTQLLERKGKLGISAQNLKKYIGKTLILKNIIAENLYIFDSPDETWDNESLNRLDIALKRTFDLQERFRTISGGLQIIKENLELFRDLLQYKNSNLLEWIVIVLILFEVLNVIFGKLFS